MVPSSCYYYRVLCQVKSCLPRLSYICFPSSYIYNIYTCGDLWSASWHIRICQVIGQLLLSLFIVVSGVRMSGPRATSHMRLWARDRWTSSTLIGGEGGAGPSSLHTTLEGSMEYVNALWMWSLHGFLHGIEWIMFYLSLGFFLSKTISWR